MKTIKTLVRGFFSLFPGPTVADFLKLQKDVVENAVNDTPGYQLSRWSEWSDHLDRMDSLIRSDHGIGVDEPLPKSLKLGKRSTRMLRELRTYVACKVDELSTRQHAETVDRLRAMNARLEHRTPGRTSPALAA